MDKSKIFTNIVTTIFFSVIISALIYNSLIYPTIIPVVKDGTIVLFRDWQIVVIANICDGKGYDVFIENPCDFMNSENKQDLIPVFLSKMQTLDIIRNENFFRTFPELSELKNG